MPLDERIQRLSETIIEEVRSPIEEALRHLLADVMEVASGDRESALAGLRSQLDHERDTALADLRAALERDRDEALVRREAELARGHDAALEAALEAVREEAARDRAALQQEHDAALSAARGAAEVAGAAELTAALADADRARHDAEARATTLGQELEQARHNADQARHETDQARQESDQARQETDQANRAANQARQAAEQAMQDANQARQEADRARQDTELARQEAAQAKAEADRASQETAQARADADQARAATAAAERAQRDETDARQVAEHARYTAEQAAETAEAARRSAEQRHLTAEATLQQVHVADRHEELACSDRTLAAFRRLDDARSLSEVLRVLADHADAEIGRAAVLLVTGSRLRGWESRNLPAADAAALDVPVDPESVFGLCIASGLPASTSDAPLGAAGDPLAALLAIPPDRAGLAVPVSVGGRVVAILYADDADDRAPTAPSAWPELAEILARHAGRCLELLTISHASVLAGRALEERAAAADRHADASPFADERREEESARRYARLLISEIKLYNDAAVEQGRAERDLLTRLGPEVERARRLYEEKIPATVRRRVDCFDEEVIRTLAGGDAGLLGQR